MEQDNGVESWGAGKSEQMVWNEGKNGGSETPRQGPEWLNDMVVRQNEGRDGGEKEDMEEVM